MAQTKRGTIDRDTRLRLLATAGVVVAVLLLVAARYGYHRDELYFVAATDRLAWGYVDQPPFTIWIAWIAESLAPGSVFALRVIPALAIGVVVFIGGLIARQLGGGRTAVLMGAAAVATAGIFLAVGHLLSTTTFDILLWSIVLYLFVQILDDGDPRLWVVLGAVAGLGLLNKHLMLFLLFGMFAGLLLTRQRRLLASRWPWLGGLVALVVWAPNLVWQLQNDWPTIEMLGSLQEGNSGLAAAIEFIGLQIPFLSIVLLPIAFIGLRRMLRPEGVEFRPIAVGFLAVVALMLLAGGKGYYVVPYYVVFLPMGMVEMEERWSARSGRFSRRAVAGVMLAGVFVMSPFFLPVLPASAVGPFNAVNPELGETVGWDELADQVAGVNASVDAAVVFTGSYGEAGAIELYGPELGLPPASSGHNAYWMWGPPPDDAVPVIVIGYGEAWMDRGCRRWDPAGTISNAAGVDNEEMGLPIAVCHEMRRPWSEVWDELRHYN
ncbi:MAG: glycosyltransferase family 39 protein [Acidimicrobiia bacterium]|nr:glycosyltransferase family 39 protein [Acidimicrobiia bacterium]